MKQNLIKNLIFLCFVLIFAACSSKKTEPNTPFLKLEFEQNATILQKVKNEFKTDGDEFLEKYFAVWNLEKPKNKFALKKLKIEAFWGLNYANNPSARFDEFGRNHDKNFLNSIKFNANQDDFGTIWQPAITTQNALLRNIPSHAPIYGDPSKAGEGYPFDYGANSVLSTGYPLLVSHFSKDGEWAFVQNDTVWGWIKSDHLHILDDTTTQNYQNSQFLTILRDKARIYDDKNATIFTARMGKILPFDFFNGDEFSGEFIGKNGKKRYFVNANDASIFPATINDKNLQTMINSVLEQDYGWGGIAFLRDCSLLTKDFSANFGIWLPRNSKTQSNTGEKYSLENLSNEEKLEFIEIHGVPYRTILYLSGHIMLYVGLIDGEAAVLHNIWGLRTTNGGRALVGKTALTTLEIGKNRSDISEDKLLLSRISAMTILGE